MRRPYRPVERAEPFPERPTEVRDDGLGFTAPVIFANRTQVRLGWRTVAGENAASEQRD